MKMTEQGGQIKQNSGTKRLILSLIAGLVFFGLLSAYFVFGKSFASEKFLVKVRPNMAYEAVEGQLSDKANFGSMFFFSVLSQTFGYEKNIKVGCFEVKPGNSVWNVFQRIRKGRQTPVRLTFNNIRTREQLAGRFAQQLMLDSVTLVNAFSNADSCAKWGLTPETIVVLFIPDTYEMYWDISYNRFMEKMQKEYNRFWTASRLAKAKEVGLTPVEIATMASIVEEESNNKAERPAIAGLYLNRYRIEMPLQADPTVKFAVKDFSLRRILFEHLTVESPYNTYKVTGLPPGPIRVPSKDGIDAVLNYQKHDYLFMCANADFSGRHAFARNMAEHSVNAKRYREELNKRGVK